MNRILITEDNVQDVVEGLKKIFYMKRCSMWHIITADEHINDFSFSDMVDTVKDLFNLEVLTFNKLSMDSGTVVIIRTGYGRGVSFHADGKTTIYFFGSRLIIHTPFDKISGTQRYISYYFQINNN